MIAWLCTSLLRAPKTQWVYAFVLALLPLWLTAHAKALEPQLPASSAEPEAVASPSPHESLPESASEAASTPVPATPEISPPAAAPAPVPRPAGNPPPFGDSFYPPGYRYPQAEADDARSVDAKPASAQPSIPRTTPILDDAPYEEPHWEGARTHTGFFLRIATGVGAGGMRYDEPFGERTLAVKSRGLSTHFEFAVGAALFENFILHGSAVFLSVYESRREVGGVREGGVDVEAGCALLGAGVTYYVMPANVYITAISGVSGMTESRDGRLAIDSRAGVGGTLSLGKEWWVGSMGDWGLGAALRSSFHTMKAQIYGSQERIYVSDIGLVFSATLN